MSDNKASVADIEINLMQALAAAIEAARCAGRIIWEASQSIRTASAAAVAATSLPGKPESSAVEGDPLQKPAAAPQRLVYETKSAADDLVTEYDRRCDAAIIEVLQRYTRGVLAEHPHLTFRFLTEELNPDAGLTDELTWIVDPIDGTMSFVHGLPDCCVSIGLAWRRRPVLAVVFNPFLASGHVGLERAAEIRRHLAAARPAPAREGGGDPKAAAVPRSGLPECLGELFTAVQGQGCFLNGTRVHVNAHATLRTALAVVNFPCAVRLSREEEAQAQAPRARTRAAKQAAAIDAILRIRGRASQDHLPGVRAHCSCALTLSQIAAGRVDAYMEPASKAWDVCAGALLITEAGGVVKNLYGMPFDMARDTSIVAGANDAMVDYFTQLCREHSLGKYWLIE